MGGGGVKMENFYFKNTYFFDNKGKVGVVSHICIYKINNRSKNVYIFKTILRLYSVIKALIDKKLWVKMLGDFNSLYTVSDKLGKTVG
jgi:hypothetical protein